MQATAPAAHLRSELPPNIGLEKRAWTAMATLPPRILFTALFLYRATAATFIVRTYFDPDEFWQAVEIAHRFTFGSSVKTYTTEIVR